MQKFLAPQPQSLPLRRRRLSTLIIHQQQRSDFHPHLPHHGGGATGTAPRILGSGRRQQQQLRQRRSASTIQIPSLGFSGAGFLACYHLGVVAALREHHQILLSASSSSSQKQPQQRLAGVSGGALVAAAVVAGVSADDGMEIVLQTSRQARSHTWDALHPGFSLIDSVEPALGRLLRESVAVSAGGEEAFLQRVNNDTPATGQNSNNSNNNQSLLWIGLTDRRRFLSTLSLQSLFSNTVTTTTTASSHDPTTSTTNDAFFWVNRYRSVDDVVAACILSSYIPWVTGPARGNQCPHNPAVARAAARLHDLIQEGRGCVHRGAAATVVGATVCHAPGDAGNEKEEEEEERTLPADRSPREIGWDGGLVDAFPVLDHQTVVVSPVAISHATNAVISPALEYEGHKDTSSGVLGSIPIHPHVRLHVSRANAKALRCLTFSSEEEVLQSKFAQGYDNATQFLRQHSLLDRTQHVVADSTRYH